MARSRSFRTRLIQLLDCAATPVYVLDEQRRIVYCNSACAAWLETTAEQLVGLRCDYHSKLEVDAPSALAAGLCPPPDVFAGQNARGVVVAATDAKGPKRREGHFVPLGRDIVQCVGVVAVLDPTDLAPEAMSREESASEPLRLHEQIRAFRRHAHRHCQIDRLAGESAVMQRVRDQAGLAATSRARVVVAGPKGSGREYVARWIHYRQEHAVAASLVPLDCSLLDAELLQSTVAAFVRRWSELERDEPSALLLLEVDQLESDAQRDLVGFLDIREFPLRTIATARQSLLDLARQGGFRWDLACALSTLTITLPGLADRPQDVPLLAQMMLEDINGEGGRQVAGFAPEAMDRLVAHAWPENLDELMSTVRRAHRAAEGPRIETANLPERLLLAAEALAHPPRQEETIQLDAFLQDIESQLMTRALRRANGNKARAARLLGISRSRLLRRIAQLGIAAG
jgi:DNA-binding NtrC family response regulator